MKRFSDFLLVAILIAIFVSTYMIQIKLNDIRTIVNDAQTPKLEIINTSQFSRLCNQFTSQWNASGYVFYLVQPKMSSKTHKEKASTSMNNDRLPIRVALTDHANKKKLINDKYIIGNSKLASKLCNGDFKCHQFLLIPIYQNDIIVGELYLIYDHDINKKSIMNKVSEAQLLGKLLN